MIVIGAKGFAKEVLEVLHQLNQLENLAFYDDVNKDAPALLYGRFPVLSTTEDILKHFKTFDNSFSIGIGNPLIRKVMYDKFLALGGSFTSIISPNAIVGHFDNKIGTGCNIMTGSVITNSVIIGNGVLINLNCTIGHDCTVGNFVEMSPGVHISGHCVLGDYTVLGTNVTVLPKITIGKNVIVGAGSVVTKNLPDNCVAVGTPAKIIKERPQLEF